MSGSLVSVVMPVRDAGVHLAGAVRSIVEQRHRALELLVVDDGSTDGALAALPASLREHARLRILRRPAGGVVAAMQAGVDQARGDFIARMDADDVALPDRIERQLAYLADHPEVDIVGGQVQLVRAGGVGGGFTLYQEWLNGLCEPDDIARAMFIECPIPNPTAVFRRAAYERLGGYRDTAWPEDYDLFLRAREAGLKMGKPRGIVLHWRDHGSRLTRCDPRYAHGRFLEASGHYLARAFPGRPVILWGAGVTGGHYHDILVDNGMTVRGFIDIHPRRIGRSKRNLPVWSPAMIDEVGEALVVGVVRARGAREKIRAHLRAQGRVEGEDFLFVA